MKLRYTKTLNLSLVLTLTFFTTCEEVLDDPPIDRIPLNEFFTSASDAETAIIGAYHHTFRSDVYTGFVFINNRSSDDLTAPLDGPQSDGFMWRPNLNTGDGTVNGLYNACYEALANINLIIQRLPQMDSRAFFDQQNPDQDRQKQIEAEARFLRAFIYYHMTLNWGGVPLILEPPNSVDPASYRFSRASEQEMWAAIMEDLNFAEENLPTNFTFLAETDADATINNKGRATKGAAMLMKARIYLRDQQWQEAIDKATELINLGEYVFTARWISIFDATSTVSQNSSESILEIQTLAGAGEFNPTGGYAWFHQDGRPRRGATLEAFDLFEGSEDDPRDVRKEFCFSQLEDAPEQIYALKYANAFPWWNPENGNPFNFVPMRLTEAYLIIAESLNELSYPSTEAIGIMNRIRERARDPDFPTAGIDPANFALYPNQDSFREFIRDERRRELMYEGHRWYDLLRYDRYDGGTRAVEAVALLNTGFEERILLPIPQLAINQNPNLEQNPDY